MPNIKGPDGKVISFPDGTSDADIAAAFAPHAEPKGFLSSFVDASGLSALAHPIDAITGIPAAVKGIVNNTVDNVKLAKQQFQAGDTDHARQSAFKAIPILGPATAAMSDQFNSGNGAGAMGTALGTALGLAGPEGVARGALPVLPKMLGRTGEVLQDAGAGIVDRAVGLRDKDVRFGAQPGRAYLDGGGTPAMSMGGIADKSKAIRDATGKKLGNVYDDASQPGMPMISTDAVRDAIQQPIVNLRAQQGGFGGTGVSPALDTYEAQMAPTFAAADARGGFTPRQLMNEVKRPLASNTNWRNQEMFDINKVRQQNVGATGGLLTDAVPEAGPLNDIYQGTNNLAARAEQRAASGQTTLRNIASRAGEVALGSAAGYATHNPLLAALPLMADSMLAKTGLGYGLYQGGRAANAASRFSLPLPPPFVTSGVAIPANALVNRPRKDE